MQLVLEVFAATLIVFFLFMGVCALFGRAYRACRKEEKEKAAESEKEEKEERR